MNKQQTGMNSYLQYFGKFINNIYHREPLESCDITCERCHSRNILFRGIVRGIEIWKCSDCGHIEEYTLND